MAQRSSQEVMDKSLLLEYSSVCSSVPLQCGKFNKEDESAGADGNSRNILYASLLFMDNHFHTVMAL